MPLLSRVADSIYWMSRYLERSEHTSRVLGVHLSLLLEDAEESPESRWQGVVEGLGLDDAPASLTDDTLAQWLALDIRNRSSIAACILSARDNASQVREHLSSEVWEQMNSLFHRVRSASETGLPPGEVAAFLAEVKLGAHLVQGLADSTMNHGEGWRLMQLGRSLERAVSVGSLLDVHFRRRGPDLAVSEHAGDIELLRCCTAFEAYCKVYTAEFFPVRIVEFLLLNQEFPHSICFCLRQAETALRKLPRPDRRTGGDHALRLAARLHSTLSYTGMEEILTSGLHAFLTSIDQQCAAIHNAVHAVYIDYPLESALES